MYAENKRGFHGHRIRPDRHRTHAGEGSLPEAHEDQGYRGAVSAVRRVRSNCEGRSRFVRRDREAGRLEDPVDRRREGDEDPCACSLLKRLFERWRIVVHASLGGERIVVAAALLSSMTLQVSHIDYPGPSWPRPKSPVTSA